jgi:hypothetical protein
MQHVGPLLPLCTARVEWENYYEQNGQAGLTYIFVGSSLEQTTDLVEYYRQESPHTVDRILKMLDNLLHQELGKRWYTFATPLICFFAAEYGHRMIEHLQLRLRPESSDGLWPIDRKSAKTANYQQVELAAIPREYGAIHPGTLVSIEGMRVRRIKPDRVRLEDPGGQGIVVGVKFAPNNSILPNLAVGDAVVVHGEVVYNQRGRMEDIIGDAFSKSSVTMDAKSIKLPGGSKTYLNPLQEYPKILNRTLEGQQSYVHGDLHLHNILVDEWGKGWLIDFALVKKHHNIFDFIKLETSLRLMALAKNDLSFSLKDYVRFEEALTAATLENSRTKRPTNSHLQTAYEVILAIRRIAQNYMAQDGFLREYFPALFLYCLSVMKYYRPDMPLPTRLVFITASILTRYLLEK